MEELDNSNVSAAGALMLVYPNLSFTAALMSVIDRLENTTNVKDEQKTALEAFVGGRDLT